METLWFPPPKEILYSEVHVLEQRQQLLQCRDY
jgi:hypothetical protein